MMTKEEYQQVVALRAQGLTIEETARRLDYHPATIIKVDPSRRPTRRWDRAIGHRVVDSRWAQPVAQLLADDPHMSGTQVHLILEAEGFQGSYPSVVRHLRAVRGPRPRPPRNIRS